VAHPCFDLTQRSAVDADNHFPFDIVFMIKLNALTLIELV
jgi:hypothetical protein